MYSWNDAGPLHRLKGMIRYSKKPKQVQKAVRASFSFLIQSLLNAEMMFSFMNIFAQFKWLRVSEIKGKE